MEPDRSASGSGGRSGVTTARMLRGAVAVSAALAFAGLGAPAVAAAESPVAPSMLNTTCSLDQVMAAARAVDPVTYGALVGRYNAEPRWVQGGITYHMTALLQAPPQQRQDLANRLGGRFPDFVALFTVADPVADQIAAKCPTFPANDPAVWNPNAPAPTPVAAPTSPAPSSPAPAPAPAP